MTNNSTKRALLSSVLSLFLCFVMLMGTTFAWFTDEVTSGGNVIKTGTLDVQFNWSEDGSTWNDVEAKDANGNHTPIFNYDLWEPGFTQVRYLEVKNNGTLALKYKLQIVSNGPLADENGVKLSDVIDVYYASSKVDVPDRDLENNANLNYLGTLTDFVNAGAVVNDDLLASESDYATLVLQMQTSAGNEYQNLTVGTSFDIRLFATQFTYEEDSYDDQYDADAEFEGLASVTVVPGEDAIVTVYDDNNAKLGVFNIPAEAIADGTTEITASITDSDYEGNFTVGANNETKVVDISVSNLKENNTTDIKLELFIGKGYDPATVTIYHYDTAIGEGNEVYNPETGYVTIKSTSFSPFTIEYDKDSEYVVPDNNAPADLPPLGLETAPQYVNANIEWGEYGQWSPTEGLDSKLEAAYIFTSTQTPEEVAASPYRSWICDFYVKLDKDLGANQIFLGGNYGSFGWVGFHNGDLTLDAGTEIPLLQSVGGAWTYEQIADLVGVFTCGVGDVDDALAGATFTVSLRLVNPEDETVFHDVAVVNHKFTADTEGTKVEDKAALDSALAGDATDVKVTVADGTYTLPSNITSENVTIVGNGENTVFDFTKVNSASGANITFENIHFQGKNENVMNGYGIQNTSGTIIYRNCTFDGAVTNEYFGNVIYIDCTFTGTGYITTYAVKSAKFVNCTFDKADSRAVLVYSHGDNPCVVTLENCTFKAAAKATTWNGDWTAAIEIDTTNIPTAGTSVTITDCEFDSNYSGLYRDKSAEGKANAVITVK